MLEMVPGGPPAGVNQASRITTELVVVPPGGAASGDSASVVTNRSVVGIMNEFTCLANTYRDGNLNPDLLDLALRLSTTPWSPLFKTYVSRNRDLAANIQSIQPSLAGHDHPPRCGALDMSTGPPPPQPVLAINDHGLLLGLDDTGAWVVWSPIHPSTSAHDRLVWLLPLLERHPDDIVATFHRHATPSPPSGLALGWLEAGWPTTDVLDVLATMKDNPKLAAGTATVSPSPTALETPPERHQIRPSMTKCTTDSDLTINNKDPTSMCCHAGRATSYSRSWVDACAFIGPRLRGASKPALQHCAGNVIVVSGPGPISN